jgi:cellobiose-specific phosphotransferase system component IIB
MIASHPAMAGDITDKQVEAISTGAAAMFAGDGKICPRFHVIEQAVFAHWREAGIPTEMIHTTEFGNVLADAALGAAEKWEKNPSDFCMAIWQLFGPGGLYRRQMVEAN